ncbi:LolA-like outer membrane lipoprotein chaperone [Nitratifractor salsuginis]|uniref:Outer membrane lipoprotein carrier protein LolA n=1 Tax=Nitratifractor salsuginis (strain DSM 16511 / JCM 12458 / E9I37-1) TaxID=749222 RepID=E6WY26_NITSE|nr:LolA-like outer membrane lipoprotein chaperone [Nitratifractor salsuginis]ADV46400.1 outer membrane lipoprotein carrier protein LolA [Nitratifractor salsuginis DSM 16511]
MFLKYSLILIALLFTLNAQGITLPAAMEAKFVQKVTNPKKKVIRYEGRLVMDNKSRFKWSYLKPSKKEVCSDGKRVLVVDHDLEQVSTYRMNRGFDLAAALKRAKHYKGRLYTAAYQGRTYTIAVDPKGYIEQIAYRDDMDNVVNIHLYNVHTYAKPMPAGRFRCTYPKSYDVIEG